VAHHNIVLSQLLRLVPRHEFDRLAEQHDGKRRQGSMNRWTQFVALSVGQLGGRSSLRDIESSLAAQPSHRYHLGSQSVSRSALGRANEKLDFGFYEALFARLYQQAGHKAPRHGFALPEKLFSLDASLIDVSMKLFPQANYNSMKAAFKLHLGLDHDGLIPAVAAITSGKTAEIDQARLLRFPKGSILLFDKGYSAYDWHAELTRQGIHFVSRLRGNAKYEVLERFPVGGQAGVLSDEVIQFTSLRSSRKELLPVRRVVYRDAETDKLYQFVTNRLDWPARLVADLYKQRWQVELFFKWIKQNLKIKAFLGLSINAVYTQVLVALCVYLMLAYLKFCSRLKHSLQEITRLLQLNLFMRRPLLELFRPPDKQAASPQLTWGW
jgi:Transposase DDE domain/Domain of unknown function (DUF4372)